MNKTALICLALVGVAAPDVVAQSTPTDQVWLAPGKRTDAQSRWYPQPVTTVLGNVVSLDDKQLSIQLSGDEVPSRIASHRVIWIRPGRTSEKESAALKLFADRKYADALRPLIDSVEERPPVWRQQWLSMLAAWAASRSGRGEIALELVSQLDARPLAPCVLAWLPIAWQGGRQPAASIDAARKRLHDDSQAVQLVAASWLLSSPDRSEAARVLKRLVVSPAGPLLGKLAACVLWRTATPPQVTENADAWPQELDDLPMVLQTGPLLVLAEKFESAGLDHEAKPLRLSLQITPVIPSPIQ